MSDARRVQAADERHRGEHRHPKHADAEFEPGVYPQRMTPRRNDAREQQAAETQTTHECPEQHGERDR